MWTEEEKRGKSPTQSSGRLKIKDLPEEERPRERLKNVGADGVSTGELLAILLGGGFSGENVVDLGNRLLVEFGGVSGLQRASVHDLQRIKGIGLAKATTIKAAVELGQRLRLENLGEKPLLTNPENVFEAVGYEMVGFETENLWVLLADTKLRLKAINKVYTGTLNSSSVRIAELFKGAVEQTASAIVLVHNHPSGDPTPSPEDVNLTRRVVQAGILLEIPLLDHIIVGDHQRFISLKREKQGFN